MEPEDSLPCLQELSTGPYADLDDTRPNPPTLFCIYILILCSHLRPDFMSGLFP
jgi:hypothetical protein